MTLDRLQKISDKTKRFGSKFTFESIITKVSCRKHPKYSGTYVETVKKCSSYSSSSQSAQAPEFQFKHSNLPALFGTCEPSIELYAFRKGTRVCCVFELHCRRTPSSSSVPGDIPLSSIQRVLGLKKSFRAFAQREVSICYEICFESLFWIEQSVGFRVSDSNFESSCRYFLLKVAHGCPCR